jgi:hypothetical protein
MAVKCHGRLHSPYNLRRNQHVVKSHLLMLTVPEAIPVIHMASASVILAIALRLAAIHAELGRKSATKQSLNARTVIAVDSHALATDQSLLRLKKDRMPMVAPRSHYNQRYKMHHYSRPRHYHQMVLVTTIGVAYRQHQQRKNPTIASHLQRKIHTTAELLRDVMSGVAPPGSIEIRKVLFLSTIPFRQQTTPIQCHRPHILNIDHRVTRGGTTPTLHTSPALLRLSLHARLLTHIHPADHLSPRCQAARYLRNTKC